MSPDARRTAETATDSELTREAEITERDVREDRGFWRKYGSPLTQALLEAPEEIG